MAVCTTCLQPDITDPHDCPGIGEIQVSRQRGRGVVVDTAPQRALIGLRIVRDLAWPANIAEVGDPDLINIADQVLYRVVGYAPEQAALVVDLVEDWRRPAVITFDRKLTKEEFERFTTEWERQHGRPVETREQP
jgi:hypothetical protein